MHIVFQLFIFVIIITFIKRGANSVDPGSPEFAMYNNSDFKDCASSRPAHTNCTWVNSLRPDYELNDPWYLQWSLENNGSFLNELDYDQDFSKGYSSYTWCELASSLKGFKVIPSSPHPSVFSYSSIMVWSFINVTAISAILTIRKRVWDDGHNNQGDSEGLEILDWFLLAYDLCSFIQWWRAFSLVAG